MCLFVYGLLNCESFNPLFYAMSLQIHPRYLSPDSSLMLTIYESIYNIMALCVT